MKKILVAALAVLAVGVVAGCDEADSPPPPTDTSPSTTAQQDEKRDNTTDDKSSFGLYMNPNNGSVGYGYDPYSGGIPLG